MFRSRTVKRALCTLLAVLTSSSQPCLADVLLDFKKTLERTELSSGKRSEKEGAERVWLGDGVARLDTERGTSWILDLHEKRLFILSHVNKNYQAVNAPVDLDSLVKGEAAFGYEMIKGSFRPVVRMASERRPAMVSDQSAELFHWSVTVSRYKLDFKEWVVKGLSLDEPLYEALLANYYAFGILTWQWMEQTLESEGVAVKTEVVTDDGRGRYLRKEVKVLESLVEVEPSEDRYRPPSDYAEIPFDSTMFFAVVKGVDTDTQQQPRRPDR